MRRVMASGLVGLAALISATASCSSSSSSSSAPTDGGVVDGGSFADAGPPFQAVHDELFTSKKWVTEGVVIQIDGAIVYEEYANGYTKDMPHLTYSVSKSIGGSLIGIAINDGLMKLTDSICNYLPGTTGTPLCDTTIEHLLHMSSGLAWEEDYGDDNVTEMLYGNEGDMGAYAASQPRANPANSKWNYSSGDADILALAFKNALAKTSMDARTYAQAKLFGPLGITSSVFEADRSGTLVFSSSWFATPRDMAKMGQLYLDDGMVGTTRVLPTGWAKYAITPAPAVSTPTTRDPKEANPGDTGGSYGAEIWLNAVSPTASQATFEYPGGTADTYAFEGHYGQKVFVIPSRKMVIARVGNDRGPEFDPSPMLQAAIAAADGLAMTAGSAAQSSAGMTRAKISPANTRVTPYDTDIPHLITGFSAKEICSCAFVVGQTDAYCTAFGQQPGLTTMVNIDHAGKKVTATYVSTSRTANFVAGAGCTLEGF